MSLIQLQEGAEAVDKQKEYAKYIKDHIKDTGLFQKKAESLKGTG
jgi:endonuclease III